MTSKQVILISSGTGPQSGKSTLRKELFTTLLKGKATDLSFASPMKAMVWEFLELWLPEDEQQNIPRMLSGDMKEIQLPDLPEGVTPRKLMQTLGTEWRNLVDQQLWTKLMLRSLDWNLFQDTRGLDVAIIDDLRFRHELKAVREWCEENGVKLWHIRVYRESNNYTPTHASEMAVFDEWEVDLHLYNDGTKGEFLAKIPEWLRGIGLL